MGTSASFARKALSCLAAALLTLALVPASAFAQEEGEQPQDAVDPQAGELQEVESEQVDEGSGSAPAASLAEGGTLASALVGTPTAFVNSDVALDGEPIVGSFTVDGLTFAVTGGSDVELVGVSSDRQQVTNTQEGDSSPVAPMLASGPDGPDADSSALALPGSVTYDGVDYAVTSIGAYAFYLSGVTSVELPATVTDVDDRAFRSSDVASVSVADGNPSYSSFDGALYSADRSSLLLIPEGKQGTVLLPKRAEVADAGKFSHCSLASAISVEEGSAAFASENGLLYTSDLTTLLRVPAGATDITIREGCTTIAAGAMEACASLATITAPASVTSISSDVFTSVPTVSLPVTALVEDAPQLTALVALSAGDGDLPEVITSLITVLYGKEAQMMKWRDFASLCAERKGKSGEVKISHGALYAVDVPRAVHANDYDKGYITCTRSYNGSSNYTSDAPTVKIFTSVPAASYRFTGTNVGAVGGYGAYALYAASSFQVVSQHDGYTVGNAYAREGYKFMGWSRSATAATGSASLSNASVGEFAVYAIFAGVTYYVALDANGGALANGQPDILTAVYGDDVALPVPERAGFRFTGWGTAPDGTGKLFSDGVASNLTSTEGQTVPLYAQWERVIYDLKFDVDSEPGDKNYLGEPKDDQTITGDQVETGDKTEITNPKRPGYVFQGWVIPNADGTEAIDQDLVYQDESDGKWYVDASKLPDYASDEGRVELTARWTSVISVDVPSAVTFYADVVTEGQESREGAASSAFGQNKVASQSEVDLRIVGLESTAVATQGSTLGADSILKKSSSATPSSSTQKIFSLYPTDKALTPDDLQDPDAVSTTKPSDAVDFALDDILLEKSFTADAFTIPAGDTLNLGYRLNLSETGTELDYDALSTLDEGQSASIANISYCFAADALPAFWTYDDDGRMLNSASIKADAEAIASGDAAITAKYTAWMNADHRFYVRWFDKGITESNADSEDDSTIYEVRILGLGHDDKSDGSGKAGITFQFVNCLDRYHVFHGDQNAVAGWAASDLRASMNEVTGTIYQQAPRSFLAALERVSKRYCVNPSIGPADAVGSADLLFVAAWSEVVVACDSSWAAYWANYESEGATYPFYERLNIVGNSNPVGYPVKHLGDGGAECMDWRRTVNAENPIVLLCGAHGGHIQGGIHSAMSDFGLVSLAPCFAL